MPPKVQVQEDRARCQCEPWIAYPLEWWMELCCRVLGDSEPLDWNRNCIRPPETSEHCNPSEHSGSVSHSLFLGSAAGVQCLQKRWTALKVRRGLYLKAGVLQSDTF
jgi:hypothetical protein